MSDGNPSILSHLSIGTNRFEEAVAFYDAVLPTLGIRRMMEHPGMVGWGKAYPEFWVNAPLDGKPASAGNGFHVGFVADSEEAVRRFYQAALAAGGTGDGEPGPRPEYSPAYYACFVRDLDGHKIEATFWDEGKL